MNRSVLRKGNLFAVLCLLFMLPALFFNYYANSFSTVKNTEWFETWQIESDALVVGRMIESRIRGLKSHYALMGGAPDWRNQVRDFEQTHSLDFKVYSGNADIQGISLSLLDGMLQHNSIERNIDIFHALNSIIFVLMAGVILFWIFYEFGMLAFILAFLAFFFSQWIVVSVRSLYWCPWTMLFPFVAVLLVLTREERKGAKNNLLLFAAGFVPMFIRAACGYEFTSTIMITAVLPLVYYAIKNGWGLRDDVQRLFILGGALLLAFFAAVAIHILLLRMEFASFNAALINLFTRISYRTGVGDISHFSQELHNSLNSSRWVVFKKYLFEGIGIFKNTRLGDFLPLIISVAVFSFTLTRFDHKDRKLRALLMVFLLSWLGHISWMVMAKGHAYIHTQINYMLWTTSMMLIFLAALLGHSVSKLASREYPHRAKKVSAGILIIVFFVGTIIFCETPHFKNRTFIRENLHHSILLYSSAHATLYYYDDTLIYELDPKAAVDNKFFLHTRTDDNSKLLRTGYDFDNFDFDFTQKKLAMPFMADKRYAIVSLPTEYPIVTMETGQFDSTKLIWGTSIALQDVLASKLPHSFIIRPLQETQTVAPAENDEKRLVLRAPAQECYLLKERSIETSGGQTEQILGVEVPQRGTCELSFSHPVSLSTGLECILASPRKE